MIIKKFGKEFNIKWWKDELLEGSIALDTETSLITSPAIIPNLIITTAYNGLDTIYLIPNHQIISFYDIHKTKTFYMYNASFDIPVLELCGFKFDEIVESGRLLDGQILFRLLNIAVHGQESKKWSLDYITELFLKEQLDKDDNIRLTFGQYLKDGSIDYKTISKEHIIYAALDPVATYLCIRKILEHIKGLPTSTNLAYQINLLGDLALSKVTKNGIYIDLPYVEKVRKELESNKIRNSEILESYGYIQGKKGNKTIFENICKQEGFKLPLTETGKINSSKLYLEEFRYHPFINAYLDFNGFRKQQNFLNELITERIYPRYNTIKLTSRTSCFGPNIQQMPRLGGIRECFKPSPGHIFIDCDYAAIELAAIACINKKLFKHSVMADLINEGKDLHTYAASKIYNVLEQDVTKQQRQVAKILNFGLVANMSPQTFVGHAAKQGVTLTLEQCIWLKDEWAKVFPEMAKYWKRGYGKTTVVTDTGFVRSNCSYTEYLNCPMQTKVAEGAKIMLYSLIKAGHKVVAFIHDQILIESKIEESEQEMIKVKEIMIQAMSKLITNVKVNVSAELKTKFEK